MSYPGPPGPPPPAYGRHDPAYPPPHTTGQLPPTYAGPPPAYSQAPQYAGPPQHGSNPYGGFMGQPQPNVTVVTQDGWGRPARPPKPASYLGLSIFVLLCCNLLFGIAAVILSSLSDNDYTDGDLEGAKCKGKAALIVSIVGIVFSFVGGTLLMLIVFFWVGSSY